MPDRNPLVSICCLTFNHEEHIAECLNGFVSQKTGFEFEILVHDDASTDSTASIVREYERKHPELFRCTYQTENQFEKQNVLVNLLIPQSKGKYIALCEGDDYWTDTTKLQQQVNALESDSEIQLSTTNLQVLKADGLVDYYESNDKPLPNSITRIHQLFGEDRISIFSTCTFVFTRTVVEEFVAFFSKHPKFGYGDWIIIYAAVRHGAIHFNAKQMAVYRHHASSVMRTTNLINHYENLLAIDNIMSKYLPHPYGKMKKDGTYWYHDQLAYCYAEERSYIKSLHNVIMGLIRKPLRDSPKEYFSHLRNLGYYAKKGLSS